MREYCSTCYGNKYITTPRGPNGEPGELKACPECAQRREAEIEMFKPLKTP